MLRSEGLVLGEIRYKDTSKILNIFTRDFGKISVMAKGAYKAKSQLMANTQSFSYNNYIFHKGRSFYYINQGDIINSFYNIRNSMDRILLGFYILELIEKSTPEEEPNEKLFLLTIRALELLSELDSGFLKFIIAFELKFISFLGYRPYLEACVECGERELTNRLKFSKINGGILCRACSSRDYSALNIDLSLRNKMMDLLYKPLDSIDQVFIDEKDQIKLQDILEDYILYSIDRKKFNCIKQFKLLNKDTLY